MINENKFVLAYDNYAFTDPLLSVEWQIGPNISSSMISRSTFSEVLTLEKNSLTYNKKYYVTATVSHKDLKFVNRTVTYEFTTGASPPKDGIVSMIPLTGTFGKTMFTFGISNWAVPR